ncbi:hypothetical protein E4417_00920 [Stenotrophomonas maltophilia]|uniref:hypothetical protein n=1 Tax=Stenotrophomonas maltophilia TaxID=40324 RepID=UPI001094C464|nr:hypothetical protein [Stenotrophomonas maltophilia]MCF3545049.1 hypothetical protein [Stenotrophomonas maltophilia]TGW22440.1 hypothetical protein E4417_00920 [Stenotrophomonas maltophilia]
MDKILNSEIKDLNAIQIAIRRALEAGNPPDELAALAQRARINVEIAEAAKKASNGLHSPSAGDGEHPQTEKYEIGENGRVRLI